MKKFIETFDDYSKKYQKLQEIETPYDDIDINKPYGVVSYGGSIGSHKKGYFNKKNGKLIATFDDEKEAKEKAKRMNSVLSKGEKSYYGMRYSAVKIKPKDFELNELGEYIFKEELYENNLGIIRDDLKANFRKFEIDADNKEDTEDLFRKLQKKYKKVDNEELWQLAKDWTGYEEDLDEKKPEGKKEAKGGKGEDKGKKDGGEKKMKTQEITTEKYLKEWNDSMTKFLSGKTLGKLPTKDIKSTQDEIVEFSSEIDELKLNWMIINRSGPDEKPKIYIGVSSPNKRGVLEKVVTGRNATNEGVWKTINDIFNGKIKKLKT